MLCLVAAVVTIVGTGPSVNTQYGRLNGLFTREGVGIWKGVRFPSYMTHNATPAPPPPSPSAPTLVQLTQWGWFGAVLVRTMICK